MKIIVGLGNPGDEYKFTRHNAGFIMIDKFAEQNGMEFNKNKFKSLVAEKNINGEKVILLKPQTYINLSGEAVKEAMSFYKLDVEDLVIIYDDIDLPIGKVRYREKGSSGTHNGMRNIMLHVKDEHIKRIKIGICGDRNRNQSLADYVLQSFTKDEKEILENIYPEVLEKIENILT